MHAQGNLEVHGAVRFPVSSTGPGIPDEVQVHRVDPVWQARRGATERAGLGLAITKSIVEAYGGRMRVESELGYGSTFFFSLRVAGKERSAEEDWMCTRHAAYRASAECRRQAGDPDG